MDNNERRGIVYVAFGYEYLLMAAHSAKTARASNPGIRRELITNVQFDNRKVVDGYAFEQVLTLDMAADLNRFVKTNLLSYTELDRGLFLDCDTEVMGDLRPAFDLLDRYDIAIKLSAKPTRKDYEVAPGVASRDFPEWNSGAIFFRNNERTRTFFQRWAEIFRESGKNRDQPALSSAVYQSPELRLLSLNAMWNTFPSDLRLLSLGMGDSRIFHYRNPEEYPAIASRILSAHQAMEPALVRNHDLAAGLDAVRLRYRFLGSRFYCRAPAKWGVRDRILRTAGLLMKAKLIRSFPLNRDHQAVGEAHRRLSRKRTPAAVRAL